jgi:hypothetical protein
MSQGTAKQYKGQPRKDWSKDDWIKHAYVHMHNPWITEEDRQYWRDKAKELQSG